MPKCHFVRSLALLAVIILASEFSNLGVLTEELVCFHLLKIFVLQQIVGSRFLCASITERTVYVTLAQEKRTDRYPNLPYIEDMLQPVMFPYIRRYVHVLNQHGNSRPYVVPVEFPDTSLACSFSRSEFD